MGFWSTGRSSSFSGFDATGFERHSVTNCYYFKGRGLEGRGGKRKGKRGKGSKKRTKGGEGRGEKEDGRKEWEIVGRREEKGVKEN